VRLRLIYPRFRKFLEGHEALRDLVKEHLVGDYTMPPSLALPIIASLTPPDVELALTDDNIGHEIDYDESVDLVALSCFTPQAKRAYEIADEFRKRGTPTVIGGLHPTGTPNEALEHASSVCIGEGESVWPRILADVRNGRLKPIYRATKPFPVEKLPIPRREIFSGGTYKWDAHLVLTTRGCPVRCETCPVPNKEGTILSMRPIDTVIDDIRSMPYKQFYFTDDTVMLPGKKSTRYMMALMERTRRLDVSIFLASTMMMVRDRAFYEKLKKGKVTSIYTVFGLDRASRNLFTPQCSSEEWHDAVELVKMIEDTGIHFFASFGIGFDEQDESAPDRILRFAHEAKIDLAEFYIRTPFPGTPFGQQAATENRILHRDYDLWNTGNVVFRPRNRTVDQLLQDFYQLWKGFYRNKDPKQTLRSFDICPGDAELTSSLGASVSP